MSKQSKSADDRGDRDTGPRRGLSFLRAFAPWAPGDRPKRRRIGSRGLAQKIADQAAKAWGSVYREPEAHLPASLVFDGSRTRPEVAQAFLREIGTSAELEDRRGQLLDLGRLTDSFGPRPYRHGRGPDPAGAVETLDRWLFAMTAHARYLELHLALHGWAFDPDARKVKRATGGRGRPKLLVTQAVESLFDAFGLYENTAASRERIEADLLADGFPPELVSEHLHGALDRCVHGLTAPEIHRRRSGGPAR